MEISMDICDITVVDRENEISEQEFTELIRALDNGEEWAERWMRELSKKNSASLTNRINDARVRPYEDVARQGDENVQHLMGVSLRGSDMQASLGWLVPLAEKGNTEAMMDIIAGYTEFGGYGDNPAMYRYWYMRAAQAGNPEENEIVESNPYKEEDCDDIPNWVHVLHRDI